MDYPQWEHAVLNLVAREFGIQSREVERYGGEVACNLRVTTNDGARYLVKVSKNASLTSLDWHDVLLEHLKDKMLSFDVPLLIKSRCGANRISAFVDGVLVHVRVMTWLDGELLQSVKHYSHDLLFSLGSASAELTKALSGIQPPSDLPRHHWLIENGLVSLDANLAQLPRGPEQELIRSIRTFAAENLVDITSLPFSTVHQDLHDQNVLVDLQCQRVSGVIDFDDAHYTVRAADLAIVATSGMMRQADPVKCFISVVLGYYSVIQLGDAEIRALFSMSMMRLAVNWSTWNVRNADAADPSYGEARSKHTWPLIQKLVNRGLQRCADEVHRAVIDKTTEDGFGSLSWS